MSVGHRRTRRQTIKVAITAPDLSLSTIYHVIPHISVKNYPWQLLREGNLCHDEVRLQRSINVELR